LSAVRVSSWLFCARSTALREKLRQLVSIFERLVLKDVAPPGLDISWAFKIYRNFNLIRFMSDWTVNEIPISCSCKTCLSNCVCRCTLLFGAVFRPAVCVPEDYIAATVPQQKACRSIQGTAGRKRLLIMEELKCNEKIVDSKIKYMQGTLPVALPKAGKPLCQPSPILPSSSDSEEETEVAASDCVG
jgi:hypothetical protein